MAYKDRLWKPASDQYLIDNFMLKPYCAIAQKLNRTGSSIYSRMKLLGLKKVAKQQTEEIENRIGTIVRPQPGVLIHYGIFPNDYRPPHDRKSKKE